MNNSIKDTIVFDGRKVLGNTITETYKYKVLSTKDHFFKHYKAMQLRHYKNDRTSDYVENGYLHVTYLKNLVTIAKGGKK